VPFALAGSAAAAQPPVGLGTAASFVVLAGSTVTNTGPSVVNGDLGVSPGTAVTGFPPGTVNGTVHAADAVASQAQTDTTTAYNDAAGRTPAVSVSGDLGGSMLTAGVYKSSSSLGLTGDVTLDAQGDPSAVFIFQVGSTLTTASSSRVVLANRANACNVYWQIGSSATVGTNSVFKGTILALSSITLNTGAKVDGRTLARNGAVTLDDNVITRGNCASTTPGGTTPGSTTPGSTTPGGTTPGSTAPGTGPGTTTPIALGTGTAIFTTGPRTKPDRCIAGFRATVRGLRIKRVVFTLDGRRLASRGHAPFTTRVRNLVGVHLLRARVTFTDATRVAHFRLRYRACAQATRTTPRFTG
jgi:Ice-binding-like